MEQPTAERLARRILSWAQRLGRPVSEYDHEALTREILAGIQDDQGLEPKACAICERLTAEIEQVRDVGCCVRCASLLRSTVVSRSQGLSQRVLRSRCIGVITHGCQRIYATRVVPGDGPIVDETSGCCPTCRPAQERAIEAAA